MTMYKISLNQLNYQEEGLNQKEYKEVSEQVIPNNLLSPGEEMSIAFSNISNERKYNYLIPEYKNLVRKYSKRQESGKPILSYFDFAYVLEDLIGNEKYTDIEKAYIWTHFSIGRGSLLMPWDTGDYLVSEDGLKKKMVDERYSWNSPVHIIVSFTDPKHADLSNLTYNEARGIIEEREKPKLNLKNLLETLGSLWGASKGDKNSSLATIRCFKEFSENGFPGFARRWIKEFVDINFTDKLLLDTPSFFTA